MPSEQTLRAPSAPRRVIAAAARRPTAAAALLYALLALAFVAPGLVPGQTLSGSDYLWSGAPWNADRPEGVEGLGSNYEESDAALQFQPFLEFARGALPDVPLWNPHIASGRPFVANMQSAIFSPFSWPSYLLPFWWSLALVAWMKLFCGALGAHLLGRALGMRAPGSLLAGLVYGFGLYFVVWLSWPLSSVWAWMPWVLLLVHLVVNRRGALPVAALALVVALQYFGGHPESSFHVLAIGSFFALLALSRVPGPERWPAIGRLAAGLVAGSALAAVALVPFLELLMRAGDLENRSAHLDDDLPFAHIVAYALPDYWGRPTGVQTEGFSITRAFYAGALPFGLAGWAVIDRPGRERIAVAATGLVAMAVVLGMPGVYEGVRAIPGFNHAYNSRLVIVGLLAIALLAGWGLDDLVERVRRPRLLRWGAVVLWAVPIVVVFARVDVSLGAIGDGIAAAWAWAEPSQETKATVLPLAALAIWVVVAGAGVALVWLRASGRLAGGAFAVAAVGLTVLDLSRAGMGQNPAIPVEHASQPVTPALQRLLDARPARFAGLAPQFGLQALPPNLSMRYGLYDARSYDFPVERRYNRLWRSAIAPAEVGFTPHQILADTREESLRALGLLGVSHLLQPPGEPPVDGVTVAYEGPDARVLENPFALPRAWVVSGQREVAGEEAQLAAITDPGFDARREAIVGEPVAGVAEGPGEPGGTARIVRYEPDRVELEVSAPGRALAVLSDLHYPGWHATVDGREADIERVDYLLRGVAVDEGEHRVVLTYAPLSWRIGWIVSLLTALLLAAVVWKGARRWRAGSSAL